MIKKLILVAFAVFAFNSFAEGSGDSEGFFGSVWVKYGKSGDGSYGDNLNYKAQVGYKGSVADNVMYGVAFSSAVAGYGTAWKDASVSNPVYVQQAYVSYKPVDEFKIKVGKYGYGSNFNKVGVLYDEDVYKEGAFVKYKYEADDQKYFVKVGAEKFTGDSAYASPFTKETSVYAKAGASFGIEGVVKIGVYAGVSTEVEGGTDPVTTTTDSSTEEQNSASTAEEGDATGTEDTTTAETTDSSDGDTSSPVLFKVGATVDATDFQVPVGAYGTYVSKVDGVGDNQSFSAGVYVGSAGSVGPGDAGDFGVSVNYFDIYQDDYQTGYLNDDYGVGAGADGNYNGVAVRAQYNVFDNTNLVVKVGQDLADSADDPTTVVGELNFNF